MKIKIKQLKKEKKKTKEESSKEKTAKIHEESLEKILREEIEEDFSVEEKFVESFHSGNVKAPVLERVAGESEGSNVRVIEKEIEKEKEFSTGYSLSSKYDLNNNYTSLKKNDEFGRQPNNNAKISKWGRDDNSKDAFFETEVENYSSPERKKEQEFKR